MDVYVDVLILKCMKKYLGMLKMLIFIEFEEEMYGICKWKAWPKFVLMWMLMFFYVKI